MATEKKINSRIQQKHDVAANWAKATNFIPKKGEIIIYDAEYNASGEETQPVRFKIGDGSKTVNNLPFAVIDHSSDIETLEQEVANNSNEISKIKDGPTQVASAKISESAFLLLNSLKIIGRTIVGAGDNEDEYNGRLPIVIRFDEDSFIKSINSVGSSVIELRNTGVKSGTYNNVTVDSKGRVTTGESKDYLTSHQSIKSINTNNTAAQAVTASEAIAGSGTINLHKVAKTGNYNDLLNKPTIPSVSGKLNKTTYEYNEELALGSNGKVLIGVFPMYDTNLTVHISSTTSTTYSGTLVIATQNFGGSNRTIRCNLYGDAAGTLHSRLVIQQSSDVTDPRIFIYGNFDGYSKNLVHIQAVGLAGPPEELVTSADNIPTTDLVTIHNVLDENFAKLTGNNKFTGDMSGVGHPYRVFLDEDAYAAYLSGDPMNIKYTSQTNAALIINTDANNSTAFIDGQIDNKKNGTKYELTLPTKTGTLATTSDIPIKSATLSGTTLTITL